MEKICLYNGVYFSNRKVYSDCLKTGKLLEIRVNVHLIKNYVEFRHFSNICNFIYESKELADFQHHYEIYFYIEEAELLKYFHIKELNTISSQVFRIPIYHFEYSGCNDLSDFDAWIMCFEQSTNLPATVFRNRVLFIFEKWIKFSGLSTTKGSDIYMSPFEENVFNILELYIRNTNLVELRMIDILKHTGSSYYSLNKIVKKKAGTTLYNHILTLKVELAKELLINQPEKRVKDIAYQLGFSNVSKFIQGFKRNHSVTPMKYRTASCLAEA